MTDVDNLVRIADPQAEVDVFKFKLGVFTCFGHNV